MIVTTIFIVELVVQFIFKSRPKRALFKKMSAIIDSIVIITPFLAFGFSMNCQDEHSLQKV